MIYETRIGDIIAQSMGVRYNFLRQNVSLVYDGMDKPVSNYRPLPKTNYEVI